MVKEGDGYDHESQDAPLNATPPPRNKMIIKGS